jgi:broad specificity phosphatase PhoE
VSTTPAGERGAVPVRIYLIRHGETEWSLTGQHTGRTDIPLTAHGEEQASAVGSLLRGITFTHVLTSPMQRARRTCDLSQLRRPAVVDPDLSEWDYGRYEGQKTVDIWRGRPGWNVFRDGCPAGETTDEVGSRADHLIAALCSLEGNVALYSHGQFGAVFAARWIGLPVLEGQHFVLDAAALSILGYSSAHPDIPVVALWNETTPTPNRPNRKTAS